MTVLFFDATFNQETASKQKPWGWPVCTDMKWSLQDVTRHKSTKAVCIGCEKTPMTLCICLSIEHLRRTCTKEPTVVACRKGAGSWVLRPREVLDSRTSTEHVVICRNCHLSPVPGRKQATGWRRPRAGVGSGHSAPATALPRKAT